MAHLAIQGHATRGREVIELMEVLGGTQASPMVGKNTNHWYYLNPNGIIVYSIGKPIGDNYSFYSLEDFLEKYPYKVGDKVIMNDCDVCRIHSMYWDREINRISYTLETSIGLSKGWGVNELQPAEEKETMKEKKINQMSLANCDLDEVEIVLGDKFELKIKDGKYYAVRKKPQYPTDYIDACSVLGISVTSQCEMETDIYGDELYALYILLVCRNAYWKIAGNWEEKRKNKAMHFVIYSTLLGEVVKDTMPNCIANYLLDFPTAEMRDAFYENFKELINECKELL